MRSGSKAAVAISLGLFLAACSSVDTNTPSLVNTLAHRGSPGVVQYACATGLLDFATNGKAVNIYSNKTLCGQITTGISGPRGLAVDAQGNLYVVNAKTSSITEYAPPYTSPPVATFDDSGQNPWSVAACPGFIAVTNTTAKGHGPGSVTIFRNGQKTTLSDPNALLEYFVTCDSFGNLYTQAQTSDKSFVNEFQAGTGKVIELSHIHAAGSAGLEWEDGALWVASDIQQTITVWKAPFKTPVSSMTLAHSTGDRILSYAVSPGDTQLLVAEDGSVSGQHVWFYNLSGQRTGQLPGSLVSYGVSYSKDDQK
jgi:hypothetical protein